MKKNTIFAIAILGIMATACEPVTDDIAMGEIVAPEQLKLDIHATTPGGNELVLINQTPGVGSYWDTGTGISTNQIDTVVMPYVGDITIKFKGLCAGGVVETTRTVTVDKIDHQSAVEWSYFAGTEIAGKTWVWDMEQYAGAVYGTNGWLVGDCPAWDIKPVDALEERDYSLVFDLNGGPNLSKLDASGKVVEKGTFSFDMTAVKKNPESGAQWSLGQLKLQGVSVLSGHAFYDPSNTITTFEIIKLDDSQMVLCWNPAGSDIWTDATFWCFRRK